MPRVLCIWLPNWPIQRLCAADAELRKRPLIVLGRDPRRGQYVTAMCAAAKRRGIQHGMPAGEVDALLGGRPVGPVRSSPAEQGSRAAGSTSSEPPGLAPCIMPHDSWADYDALCQLAIDCTDRFSPIVATEHLGAKPWAGRPRHQRDSLLLDITGLDRLLGGEGGLGRRIVRYFRRRQLAVRVGIAQTVGAAVAVARYGATDRVPIAVPAGQETRYVDPLPVEALRIEVRTADALHQLGIDTIGRLRRLPRDGLAARFGNLLLQRLDQVTGRTAEAIETVAIPARQTLVTELDYPTRDRDILLHSLAQSLGQLTSELAARNEGVLRFSVRLGRPVAWTSEIMLGLYAPSTDVEHLLGLVEHRLQTTTLSQPVEKISVRILLSSRIVQRQMEWFANDTSRCDSNPQRLAHLIDTLSGRLGRNRVLGVKAIDEPAPEFAFEAFSLTEHFLEIQKGKRSVRSTGKTAKKGKRDYASRRKTWGPSRDDPLRRPLRLLQPARRLVPLSLDSYGVPKRFCLDELVYDAARHWGPERIETGWWRGNSIRRDYYRLETIDGLWLWIYTDQQEGWWLHGMW